MTNNLRCLSAWAVILGQTLIAPSVSSAQERGPAGTVTLSRTDYDRLLDLAAGQPRPPDGGASTRGPDARRPARARRRRQRPRHDDRRRRGVPDRRGQGPAHQPGHSPRRAHRRAAAPAHGRGQRARGDRHRAGDVLGDARLGRGGHDVARPRFVRAAGAPGRKRDGDVRRPWRAVRPARVAWPGCPADIGRRTNGHRGHARSRHADDRLLVGARNRTDGHAARHPHARRHQEPGHDRRCGCASPGTRRSDDRAGRAVIDRGSPPRRLRARRGHWQFPGAQRTARRSCRAVCHAGDAAATSVPVEPRAIELRRLLQSGHWIPDHPGRPARDR